jgi:hypothetical protein
VRGAFYVRVYPVRDFIVGNGVRLRDGAPCGFEEDVAPGCRVVLDGGVGEDALLRRVVRRGCRLVGDGIFQLRLVAGP